jgi:CRP-like cAMP-binding protein
MRSSSVATEAKANSRQVFADSIKEGQSAISKLSTPQGFPAGVEIFNQGTISEAVYRIDSGLVKITSLCETGREIILSLRSTNWLLGAASLILQKPNLVQATTLTYCQLRCVPAEAFFTHITSNIAYAHFIQKALSCEIYEQMTPVVDLICRSARHRLEHFLWTLVSGMRGPEFKEEVRLRMPLRHWEAAQLLAVTPAYFSRLLNQMEEERILRRKNGFLIIHDPQKLRHDSYF